MTRLKSHDIAGVSAGLEKLDAELREKTGRSLFGIACHAAGIAGKTACDLIASARVGVVPMTCGQGLIGGFADTVRDIATHIGFDAFVTRHTDVAGIAEAFERKADILMMADDDRFIALNIKRHRVIDNALATGEGFAAGLDLMVGGLKDRRVLIIGCGSVGRSAAIACVKFGAKVSVYDVNRQRSVEVAKQLNDLSKVNIQYSLQTALSRYQLLIDATNSANVIGEKEITPDTFIAAPGIPLGLTEAAYAKVKDRLLHDPLQTGVATMGVMALVF